jgi:hypothetical protein
MPTTTIEIEIAAEPESVFETLLETAGYQGWVAVHASWPDGPPELAAGAMFEQQVNLMGRSTRLRWTVDALVASVELSLAAEGPLGLRVTAAYRLEAVAGGTVLTFESMVSGGPLGGRLGGAFGKRIDAANGQTIANLKRTVESGRVRVAA